MAFRGWPVEAIEFFDGLEADNSKAYWQQNKDVYEQAVKAPMDELLAELAPPLGPATFGVFALAFGIGTLLVLPADFGISQSMARFLAERRGDRAAAAAGPHLARARDAARQGDVQPRAPPRRARGWPTSRPRC